MKVSDMFYEKACASKEGFLLAIEVARENERERILESLDNLKKELIDTNPICDLEEGYNAGIIDAFAEFRKSLTPKDIC